MANKSIVAQKEEKVKALAEEIKGANLVLIVDYRGTTVEDDTKLRKDLRECNGVSKVVKFAKEDYLSPLKVAYKFSTKHENYQIKGGFIEGKLMSKEEIITLAKLPSREELLSKLAGSLLQTIAKVAVAIDQVRIKKEEEGDASSSNTEEVKETVNAEAPKAE